MRSDLLGPVERYSALVALCRANPDDCYWLWSNDYESTWVTGIKSPKSNDRVLIDEHEHGFLLYKVPRSGEAQITFLCVDKHHRRQGVATSLIARLKENVGAIFLQANTEFLIKMYAKQGFVEQSRAGIKHKITKMQWFGGR